MSKKIVIIFIIIFITFVGCVCLFKFDNKTKCQPISDNLSYTDSLNQIETEYTINVTPKEFIFTLKKEYTSREEILLEIEKLKEYYFDYCVNKTVEEIELADTSYKSLLKILNDHLNSFLPSDLEILTEKERMLKQYVFFKKEDLTFAKNSYKNNPVSENSEKVKRAKNSYDNAEKILKKYEKKEITIDEALEKLGVQNSRTLENYYKQIEAAKN